MGYFLPRTMTRLTSLAQYECPSCGGDCRTCPCYRCEDCNSLLRDGLCPKCDPTAYAQLICPHENVVTETAITFDGKDDGEMTYCKDCDLSLSNNE